MGKHTNRIKRMLVLTASIAAGLLLVVAGVLLAYSPGMPEPYRDAGGRPLAGSLSEKVFVEIGGVRQGMFLRSRNVNHPVLLYVHGGPAFPNYFLIDKYNPGLEDYFTVCYWEQRGGGLSYSSEVTPQSMTFDRLAADAVEVTRYLRKRFGKDRIYLMAHSGGTPIGLLAVARNPELYSAYIAMAQVTNQVESEKIAYRYMLEQYRLARNQKAVKALLKYPVPEADSNVVAFYKSALRDKSMHELGIGTMHRMKSVFWDIFIPVWTCKAYTLPEKIAIWKSKFSFLPRTNLIPELLSTDFATEVAQIDVPVYFFSGKFDLTVNIDLSKAYFRQLRAPLKGFYIFDHSAHSPLFEEPASVRQIIEQDILRGRADLANGK